MFLWEGRPQGLPFSYFRCGRATKMGNSCVQTMHALSLTSFTRPILLSVFGCNSAGGHFFRTDIACNVSSLLLFGHLYGVSAYALTRLNPVIPYSLQKLYQAYIPCSFIFLLRIFIYWLRSFIFLLRVFTNLLCGFTNWHRGFTFLLCDFTNWRRRFTFLLRGFTNCSCGFMFLLR